MNITKQEQYHYRGLILEKVLSYVFNHLDLKNSHNHFDTRYVHGYGVDNIISTSKGNVETECKNLNGKYQLSRAWVNEEVLCRHGYKPLAKILVASILNVSRKVRRLIERNNIRIIELGYQVTKFNFKKAVHDLIKKLYFVKVRYHRFVGVKPKSKQVRLSCFDKSLLYNVFIDVVRVVSVRDGWQLYLRVTDGCG